MVDRFGAPDWDKDPDQVLAPGGESWTQFYERCVAALLRIVATHEGELVVLVVHGGVIEQAMKLIEGRAPGDRLRLNTENASMTEIEFKGARRRLLRYNDRAPLAAE
jgi:probable phosphoglycerate mutase